MGSMDQADTVLKEGAVQKLKVDDNKFHTWESRYLVLRSRSGQTGARLDWHFDKSSYISSTSVQEFSHILLRHIDDKEHSLELVHKNPTLDNVVLAVESRTDLTDWMFLVHDLIDPAIRFEDVNKQVILPEYVEMKPVKTATSTVPTFRVKVDETTISRSRGMAGRDYQIQMLPDMMVFSDIKIEKLIDFEYTSIRRFMRGMNNFTFETSPFSSLGGGVWRLLTHEASVVSREYERAARDAWKKHERSKAVPNGNTDTDT